MCEAWLLTRRHSKDVRGLNLPSISTAHAKGDGVEGRGLLVSDHIRMEETQRLVYLRLLLWEGMALKDAADHVLGDGVEVSGWLRFEHSV